MLCRGWPKALATDAGQRSCLILGSGLKFAPLVPATGRFLGQRAAGRSSPGLSAGPVLCEGRMDEWDVWAAQAGGTRAPGWLLCTAHGTALHRMALPSLQLISASKLFSAVFPKTS